VRPPGEDLRPSVTVVLLRDGPQGVEVLLVRRHPRLAVHGGAWVFPGGGIDPADGIRGPESDPWAPARRAAVRETLEEAGLRLALESLVPMACWVTPEGLPRRYRTWFFAALAPAGGMVQVDRREIVDHRWLTPAAALAAQGVGDLELPPPTFVTLHALAGARAAAPALEVLKSRVPRDFRPRIRAVGGGMIFFYQTDAGYTDLDHRRPGPRHRLWVGAGGWRYENDDGG